MTLESALLSTGSSPKPSPIKERNDQSVSREDLASAMAAGVTDRLWHMADIVKLIDDAASKPGLRGPYKKVPNGN